MKPMRQGDVLISPTRKSINQLTSQKIVNLVLAEGEVTGHRHRISEGKAELYRQDKFLLLKVLSETSTLTHEEHKPIKIPQGTWMVQIQREYQPEAWQYVSD